MAYKVVTAGGMARVLIAISESVPRAVLSGVRETGMRLQGDLVQREIANTTPHQPVDVAQYKGSWRGESLPDGYLVYNISKQALWIERGREPGGKPGAIYRALKPWARRKNIPKGAVWPIAVKIAAAGYRPRWVLKRASERARPIMRAAILRALGQKLGMK